MKRSIPKQDLIAVGALVLGTAAVYLPALRAGFFSDDFEWLGRMNATLERPGYVFSVIYRDFNPVLHLSFLADWLIGDGSAVVFHLHSLTIHLANTVLLYVLSRRLGCGPAGGFAVTLMWAWNVRLSEAVIWPAARGHSLATLFVLAAFVALLSRLRGRQVLTVALFLLALLTKETALMPLFLVPVLLGRDRKHWPLYGTLGSIAAGFVLFNLLAKPEFHATGAPPGQILLKIPFILLRPVGLGDFYDFSYLAAFAVMAVVAALAVGMRGATARLGWAWILVCAIPVVALDKLSSRYLYMMAIGYGWVAWAALVWVARRMSSPRARRALQVTVAAGVVAVSLSGALWIREEIRDYAQLARPYTACVDGLRPELEDLAPGEKVVVVDLGPREAIPRLARRINERPTITKLIPLRPDGIDGLIELPDLINVTHRRAGGMLGYATSLDTPGPTRFLVFDGERVQRVRPIPEEQLPPDRVFVARWGTADRFFESPETR
jgi:hypothetical protein